MGIICWRLFCSWRLLLVFLLQAIWLRKSPSVKFHNFFASHSKCHIFRLPNLKLIDNYGTDWILEIRTLLKKLSSIFFFIFHSTIIYCQWNYSVQVLLDSSITFQSILHVVTYRINLITFTWKCLLICEPSNQPLNRKVSETDCIIQSFNSIFDPHHDKCLNWVDSYSRLTRIKCSFKVVSNYVDDNPIEMSV